MQMSLLIREGIMVLFDNGKIETEDGWVSNSVSSLKDCEETPAKGDLLVARKSLSVQTGV